MASNIEVTFGSRLSNAEQLATHLASFSTYAPVSAEYSLTAYNALLTTIKSTNESIATLSSQFSLAVDNRVKLFTSDPTSLLRIITPIGSYIRARFGKASKQATDIGTYIKKIRGEKTTKLKKNQEGEFVSQSERSYGSRTKHLADIVATLTGYGTSYTPTNPDIELPQLNALLQKLNDASNIVTSTYGQLKTIKDTRLTLYTDLAARSLRIKDGIKSQYGIRSSEYALVKGLKI